MSYEKTIELLPSSIYEKGLDSNNFKLWKLFSTQLDDVEDKIKFWYDKENLSGEALDKIGLLKGIFRNGLGDEDYRYELSLPRTVEIVTLDSVYQTLIFFGTNARVKELHTPFMYDIDRFNSVRFLDTTWNLFPNIVPVVQTFLNADWLLDGLEPIEPFGVRPLALFIKIDTDETYQFAKLQSEIKKLLAGITVYYQFNFTFDLGLSALDISNNLDSSTILDSLSLLSNDLAVVFYLDNVEQYRIAILENLNPLNILTLKKNYTIDKIEIVKSGITLASKVFNFETSNYLQYKFIIS